MKKRKKGLRDLYKPYIRRMNGKEYAVDLRNTIRLAGLGSLRHQRPVYVMVQKGWPNRVIAVGYSKRQIKKSILVVDCGRKTFNQWAHETKRYAQK